MNSTKLLLALSLLAASAQAQLVRVESPEVNSLALAQDAIRTGALWLVYTDGSQVETAGDWKLTERTIQFHDAHAKALLSVRLADIDMPATQTFNEDVRSGWYVDHRVKQLENMQVRPLDREELRQLATELRAEGVKIQEKIYGLEDRGACGNLRGAAAQLCRMNQTLGRPSASAAFDKLVAQKRWIRTGQ